jgi:hypothetical protein
MSRSSTPLYPFLLVPPRPHDAEKLVERFKAHLRDLRYAPPTTRLMAEFVAKRQAIVAAEESAALGEWRADIAHPWPPHHPDAVVLSAEDLQKIRRRARCLAGNAMPGAKPYGGLKKEEIDRIKPVEAGVPAVMAGNEAWADQIAADLHAEMPWLAPATEHAWHVLRRAARQGGPLTLQPVILNGPWGIGKSAWARRLADMLSLPSIEIDATKSAAGFALTGLERGWGTAQPGRPLELILDRRVINPLVVVDELCKSGALSSSKGTRFSFSDALLSLLEPATSRRWECPTLRLPFDMSRISWIMTSNTTDTIPEAVLTRAQLIELPDITLDDLIGFARRRGEAMALSDTAIEATIEALKRGPAVTRRRFSLRDVNRLLARADVLENKPILN